VSPELWAAIIGAVVIVVVQIGASLFVAGRMSGGIDALSERITRETNTINERMSRNEQTDHEQWASLKDHEGRMSWLEAKVNGGPHRD
jgi:hypothetical protein